MSSNTINSNDSTWLSEVNKEMLRLYSIDSTGAGWDEENIKRYKKMNLSPRDFVEWYGEKYDLLNIDINNFY